MAKKDAKRRNLSGRTRVHDCTADGEVSFKTIAKAIGTTEPGAVFIYNRAMQKLRRLFMCTRPQLNKEFREHLRILLESNTPQLNEMLRKRLRRIK